METSGNEPVETEQADSPSSDIEKGSPQHSHKTKAVDSPAGPQRSSDRAKKAPERFKEETAEEKGSDGGSKKKRKRKSGAKKEKESKKKKADGKKKSSDKSEKKTSKTAEKKSSEKKTDEAGKKKRKSKGDGEGSKKDKEKKSKKSKQKAESNDDPDKLYCCNEKYSDKKEYIGCSKEKACKSFEWFHVECVGLTHAQVTRLGDWFCDACKKADAEIAAEQDAQPAAATAPAKAEAPKEEELDFPDPQDDDEDGEGDLPADDEESAW